MLILETTRSELLKPLQTISGIIERRHTMPILSNVLIENKSGQVSFLGTDLEIQMHTLGPKVDSPDFAFTTNVKKFLDILRALPESALVRLDLHDNLLTIRSGKGCYNLQVLPVNDFPSMKAESEVKIAFSLTQKVLYEMFSLIQYAMAAQDIRYYLMGVLLQIENNELKIVATDGHRLAYASHPMEVELPDVNDIIIPRKTVLELYKLLTFPDDLVTVQILSDKIRFLSKGTEILSKIIDSKFPNYKAVIPLDNRNIFSINRTQLLGALERVNILANEKLRGVNLFLRPGKLTVACSNNEQEEAQEELEIAYQGDSLDMAFNILYILDVLRSVNSEDMELAFGTEKSSGLFTIPNNDRFKYVVMPMRI
ncbi:DNA polymerase III subunit beta [Neisseriaceae bacterium PsAf]|nr:DNA polymerase III subunit beta [Neisseriaceae bacterium PsAf]